MPGEPWLRVLGGALAWLLQDVSQGEGMRERLHRQGPVRGAVIFLFGVCVCVCVLCQLTASVVLCVCVELCGIVFVWNESVCFPSACFCAFYVCVVRFVLGRTARLDVVVCVCCLRCCCMWASRVRHRGSRPLKVRQLVSPIRYHPHVFVCSFDSLFEFFFFVC